MMSREDLENPTGAVVPTRERGNKCRIVSKHDAPTTRLAHKLRTMLFAALRRDSRVSGVLSGDHHAAAERIFKGSDLKDFECKVLSSDLSAASDLLPMDLMMMICEGVKDGVQNLPLWASTCLDTMVGP